MFLDNVQSKLETKNISIAKQNGKFATTVNPGISSLSPPPPLLNKHPPIGQNLK